MISFFVSVNVGFNEPEQGDLRCKIFVEIMDVRENSEDKNKHELWSDVMLDVRVLDKWNFNIINFLIFAFSWGTPVGGNRNWLFAN